jgi:hypothetical protein
MSNKFEKDRKELKSVIKEGIATFTFQGKESYLKTGLGSKY